jgi:phosphoribosylaminoimidazole-succinocarboxamide synthase
MPSCATKTANWERTRVTNNVLLQSDVKGFPCRRGKIRDIYDLGDRLVIVASDRISAFDWVMRDGIPDKGRVLSGLTRFWLDFLKVPNHLITMELADLPPVFQSQKAHFAGRTMLVKKADVVPVECVVRGYLAGSGWKEYRASGKVCGISLSPGLEESQILPEPIFTPATKEDQGHDINISFDEMVRITGNALATEIRQKSIEIYVRASEYAKTRGIILADTKFEWGLLPDRSLILIDEVLTPDSSRFWPRDQYRTGMSPPSFDKQFLRDWLETTSWDKNSQPPSLPADVISRTREKYLEAYERLTGAKLPSF